MLIPFSEFAAVLLKANDILCPEPAEAAVPRRCGEEMPILLTPSPFPKIELRVGCPISD
jgi:hypothetical protein